MLEAQDGIQFLPPFLFGAVQIRGLDSECTPEPLFLIQTLRGQFEIGRALVVYEGCVVYLLD